MAVLGYLPKLQRGLRLAFVAHFLHDFSIKMFFIWCSIYGQSFNAIPFFLLKISNKTFLLTRTELSQRFKIFKSIFDHSCRRFEQILLKKWQCRTEQTCVHHLAYSHAHLYTFFQKQPFRTWPNGKIDLEVLRTKKL